MDIQLQELIDKIKKDAIESGSQEAARLKSQAESDAKGIVETAKKEAEEITLKAKIDAEKFEKAGVAALEQASRNLVLAFKGEIQSLLDKIIAQGTFVAYGEDVLKAVLPDILKAYTSSSKGGGIDVLLSEANVKKLQGWFDSQLSAELKKGAELKTDRNLGAGFRIVNKDGSAYYDYSAESATELLVAYLNPRLGEILRNTTKGI